MLDGGRHSAEDALLDRGTVFVLPKSYADFLARPEAPPDFPYRNRRAWRYALKNPGVKMDTLMRMQSAYDIAPT